jgi:hypothetical protein
MFALFVFLYFYDPPELKKLQSDAKIICSPEKDATAIRNSSGGYRKSFKQQKNSSLPKGEDEPENVKLAAPRLELGTCGV